MLRPPFGPNDRKFIRRQLVINLTVYLSISFVALVLGSNLVLKGQIRNSAQSPAITSTSAQASK